MDRIRHLWAHHCKILLAFCGALVVIAYFGIKTTSAMIYWMDPAHQDQMLAPWMSPRYVAQSYKLPPEVLGPALFIEKGASMRRVSLESIAEENGLSMDALQVRIDDAAAQWRAELGLRP